jgi:hypothetical protein
MEFASRIVASRWMLSAVAPSRAGSPVVSAAASEGEATPRLCLPDPWALVVASADRAASVAAASVVVSVGVTGDSAAVAVVSETAVVALETAVVAASVADLAVVPAVIATSVPLTASLLPARPADPAVTAASETAALATVEVATAARASVAVTTDEAVGWAVGMVVTEAAHTTTDQVEEASVTAARAIRDSLAATWSRSDLAGRMVGIATEAAAAETTTDPETTTSPATTTILASVVTRAAKKTRESCGATNKMPHAGHLVVGITSCHFRTLFAPFFPWTMRVSRRHVSSSPQSHRTAKTTKQSSHISGKSTW